MFEFFFGAVAALTLWTHAPGAAAPQSAASSQARRHQAPSVPQTSQVNRVEDLYSLRARRRMAAYLRIRLLEWRAAGLERAAEVIEHRLPVDSLVPKH